MRISMPRDPDRPTSLDLYLKEIGEYPLLTPPQERALARRARAGDAAAAEALVTCNLRFVVMIAKKYQYLGLSLEDLIHEGNVGMLLAAPKFARPRGQVRLVRVLVGAAVNLQGARPGHAGASERRG